MSFKPISIQLSPNTEADDVMLALKLLFQPWRWVKGKAPQRLEETFRKYLNAQHAFAFNQGRTCEYEILKAMRIGQGDEVLVQAFTCIVVVNPIVWLGAKPIFVDIEEDTYNMDPEDLEKKITPKSRAIIVQHTFGKPANMDRILEIAKKHNLYVIEDCAHSLGAEYKGKLVGTLRRSSGPGAGDAAFFSFGREKVISGVQGGMITTNNEKFARRLRKAQHKAKLPSHWWTFQHLVHPVVFAIILPIYNFLALGKAMLVGLQKLGVLTFPVTDPEKACEFKEDYFRKMPNALAELVLRQFGKLGRFNEHRRERARYYGKKLFANKRRRHVDVSPTGKTDEKSIYLRYTIRVKNRDEVKKAAQKQGILLGDWYYPSIAAKASGIDDLLGYEPTRCPVVERVSKEVLNLPTHIGIGKKEAERVVKFVKGTCP